MKAAWTSLAWPSRAASQGRRASTLTDCVGPSEGEITPTSSERCSSPRRRGPSPRPCRCRCSSGSCRRPASSPRAAAPCPQELPPGDADHTLGAHDGDLARGRIGSASGDLAGHADRGPRALLPAEPSSFQKPTKDLDAAALRECAWWIPTSTRVTPTSAAGRSSAPPTARWQPAFSLLSAVAERKPCDAPNDSRRPAWTDDVSWRCTPGRNGRCCRPPPPSRARLRSRRLRRRRSNRRPRRCLRLSRSPLSLNPFLE